MTLIGGGLVGTGIQIKNRVIINEIGNWPEVIGGAVNLVPFTEYYIGSNDVVLPARAIVTGPTAISGAPAASLLTYLGTEPFFTGVDFGQLVINVNLDFPNSALLDVEGDAAPTTSLVNLLEFVAFRSGSLGTYKDLLGVTFDLVNFLDLGQGLSDIGTLTAIISAERIAATSSSSSFKFFDFGTNVYGSFEFSNVRTVAPAGAFAFSGLADNGNIAPDQIGNIFSCEFIGGVTPLENITADDFRYRFRGNGSSIINTNPGALLSFVSNSTPTTVVEDTPTKLTATWVLNTESHFESNATGQVKYLAELPIRAEIDIVIDMEPVTANNKDIVVYLALNGSEIVASGRKIRIDASNPRPIPVVWSILFNQNDTIDVFVENQTDSVSLLGISGVCRISS